MYISNGKTSIRKPRAFAQPLRTFLAIPYSAIKQFFYAYKTLLRAVKITGILILIACLHTSARTAAQPRISIAMKSAPLEKVLAEIEKRSGYNVFYNAEVLKYSGPVTIDMKDAAIDDVMHYCLKGLPLAFSIQDKTIFVMHDNHKSVSEVPGYPGNKAPPTVTTVVHGENGAPLVGASVYIKALNKSGETNANGEFALNNVPDGEYQVEITFIGYEKRTATIKVVGHEGHVMVDLKQATNSLDAPVVIPYGTTTQRLNTGDVTTVTSKEIEEQPVSNVLAALEGRVPGLLITQTTGLPGGGFKVQIRGQNSIANGNDPFYVIDGVPYNSQLPAQPLNTALYGGSPLNYINPYDIESVEVLKDADATAIYGSRAANGAILITTKKGKAGNMKFDLNFNYGLTNPAHTIGVLNTPQYLSMRHEAFKNDGQTPGTGDHDVNGDWDTTRNDNWAKILTNKPAEYTNVNASVSGGNANTQFLIGAGYNIQKTGFPTLLPGDGGDNKASVHFNFGTNSPDKRFRISITGSYVADKNTVQSEDFTNDRLNLPPDAPAIFNADGSLNWAPLVPGEIGTWSNPYSPLYFKSVGNTSNLVGNSIISYALLKGLELKASLGYTNTQTDEYITVPTTYYDPARQVPSGHSRFNTTNSHSWIIEPQIDYKLRLGRGTFNALGGASFHENNTSAVYTYATGFISDALLEDIQAASTVNVNSNSSQYRYQAVFGRLSYDWMDKYLLNFTARRDGTSRFGPGKQFGNFGAVGAGWIFTREDFIQKNLGFLSFGKLRASYGTTGSDQIGNYQFVDLYNVTSFLPYQGSQGLYPTSLFNPILAWETTKKLEEGVELGFLKDRIIIQANFYRNRTGNELVQTPVTAVTGFATIPSNLPALVQNTGKEFILNTINIKTKNFGWTSSFNLSISRNKLLSYPNLSSSPYEYTLVVGQPLSITKLYHSTGVNDTTGLYQFTSAKGGNTYSPAYVTDANILLDRTPRYFGGFQNSISYKGFSIDIFFQFVKQKALKLWAANGLIPGLMFNQPTEVLDRWQNPGDKKPFQQFTQNYGSAAVNTFSYAQQSDFAYGDASFIRLKNVAISWQMPSELMKKCGLGSFRIYMQGQNLLTITRYDGLDPETQVPTTGPRRAYTAGLEVGW